MLDILYKMLRFRTALLLLLFVAVADAASKPDISTYTPKLIFVAATLAAWYVFSTSINDLSDEEIDKVNLKGYHERPLANGEIGRKQLWLTAGGSAALALILAAGISTLAVLLTAGGLALSYIYSYPPIRLSARGLLAPLTLPIGYVVFPFFLTALANDAVLDIGFLLLTLAFYFSFSGRIILKDFRDIEGDRRFGKRTFLVRHGQVVVCSASAIFWIIGYCLILLRFSGLILAPLCILPIIAFILMALQKLKRIEQLPDQLQYVGLIGRMANGSALVLLVALYAENDPDNTLIYAALMPLLVLFVFLSSWLLYERPMRASLSAAVK